MKNRFAPFVCFALGTVADTSARGEDPPAPIELTLSPRGDIGAWQLRGPFAETGPNPLDASPPGIDEAHLLPRFPSVGWRRAAAARGPISARTALAFRGKHQLAYATGTIRIAQAARYYVGIGSDDGIKLFVDGKPVFQRDDARTFREDDDLLPIDLTAGEHTFLLKLHLRESAGWSFHMRMVDDHFESPIGARWVLPGTDAKEAPSISAEMAILSLDRGLDSRGFHPSIQIRFPNGRPLLADRANFALEDDTGTVRWKATRDLAETTFPIGEAEEDFAKAEGGNYRLTATYAEGRKTLSLPLLFRRGTREAIAAAEAALRPGLATSVLPGTTPSMEHLRDRLRDLATRGDQDVDALSAEEHELSSLASALLGGRDPYRELTGPLRRAHRSSIDGSLSEYGLYVPPSFRRGSARRYPLIVVLHGLNGLPMAALTHFFGFDPASKSTTWQDRHLPALGNLEAFVLTPSGRGNSMYRAFGEEDVLEAIHAVKEDYPIDDARVSVTGPSMGGSGSALLALRHPDLFSAAAPLCGYHSYFLRGDMRGRALRPWEKFLAEERSNVEWAENGIHVPMFIVHGTQDLPEANSGVLIDRYLKLGYSVEHEHPNLGHNVWTYTYGNLRGARWLTSHQRDAHPRHVHLRTPLLRYRDQAWLHVDALDASGVFGDIDAEIRSPERIEIKTSHVKDLHLDRDPKLLASDRSLALRVDGSSLSFEPSDPLEVHRLGSVWQKGTRPNGNDPKTSGAKISSPAASLEKRAEVTGPFREIFHSTVTVVYGADDPVARRMNEEIARAWVRPRWGVSLELPVMSDSEFLARGERADGDHTLLLVGNARSNRLVRELEPGLPFRIEGDALVARDSGRRFLGNELGVAFVYPNPKRADRLVAVIEGATPLGTWRSLSLPELLPDFIVYDDKVAGARGNQVLANASVLAGGFFGTDWKLPTDIEDPQRGLPR